MTRLAIVAVGALASALIKLIGLTWEFRAFAAVPVFSLMVLTAGLAYASHDNAVRTPAPASVALVSWGERDATVTHDDDGTTGPAHLIYATVRLTSGDTTLHIPDINHPDSHNRLWLTIDDTTRQGLGGHITTDSTGLAHQWLPSHQTRLMPASGSGEPLPIPGSECSALDPHQTCTVTVAWALPNYGPTGGIHSLVLDTTSPDGTQRESQYIWPDIGPQPTCAGDIEMFCSTHATSLA